MCELLLAQLRRWQSNDSIIAVVLLGEGEKGFCAGGDVAEVVREIRSGKPNRFAYGDSFFTVEYELDYLMHTYAKPLVTMAHGICMGGGVGLSVAGSHRFVGSQLKMAMPEIHIGLFPDVGGGWFLNKAPGKTGLLLALTGMVIGASDAIFCGLADYYIPTSEFNRFTDSLSRIEWGKTVVDHRSQLTQFCREFREPYRSTLEPAVFQECFFAIDEAMNRAKVSGVMKGLKTLSEQDPRFAAAEKNLRQGSPTAAILVFEYMKRTKQLSLREVLDLDLRLAKAFSRGKDFPEGVRALLIDKDKNPQWSPGYLVGKCLMT